VSVRARAVLIGSLTLIMLVLAYPSFFSKEARLESDWIGDQGINLGLDLQGGIHWLLRIDERKAVLDELESIASRLRDAADADGISYVSIEVDAEADRVVVSGAVADTFQKLVEDRFDSASVQATSDGGTVIVTLANEWTAAVVDRGVRQALDVLDRRINGLGVTEPIIAPQGKGRILVQMPGEVDPRQARGIISKTTFLEFKTVITGAPNEELLLAQYPEGLPEGTEVVVSRTNGDVTEAVLVADEAVLNGAMLEDARLSFDRTGRPVVGFTWNNEGTEIFREFTSANVGERMAAIVDNEVITAPVIRSRIGKRGQIEGRFTQQEAADLAVQLRSGALPIPLLIEEERTVGPALGADSIRSGIRSILVGGILVVIFMTIYYRTSGFLANVALAVNLLIIIGLMSLAQATLTLPGIAGLVLTVGMAVDANVIIFERIREELRADKPLRNAIQVGFNRSRLTILDANITTMIAAVVLLYYGRGPVQGFGVTLAIGIFSSVLCALFVTRLLIDAVAGRSDKLRI